MRPKERRPVCRRRMSVEQVSVGSTADVREIGRRHAHRTPHQAVRDRLSDSPLSNVRKKGPDCMLMVVVVVALLLEIAEDGFGIFVGPVREHDRILAIALDRILAGGRDDNRTVVPRLLLEMAVAMIPVGSALPDRKVVDEGLTWIDSPETQTRDPIYGARRPHTVPVNRGLLLELVGDGDRHRVALTPAQ